MASRHSLTGEYRSSILHNMRFLENASILGKTEVAEVLHAAAGGAPEALVRELERTETAVQRATGQRPIGFRGPGYSWSTTLLEILADRGYLYDASTLPTYLGPLARPSDYSLPLVARLCPQAPPRCPTGSARGGCTARRRSRGRWRRALRSRPARAPSASSRCPA